MSDWFGPVDLLGWLAAAVFASSYFFSGPAVLRRVQAVAAGLWIIYGVVIQAPPVIVANLLVAGLALYSSFRQERQAANRDPLSP